MAEPRKGSGLFPRVARTTPPLGTPATRTSSPPAPRRPATIPPPPSSHTTGSPSSAPGSGPTSTSGSVPISFPAPSALPGSGRVDFGLMTPAARVVEELLCVEPNERVAIVHDESNAEVAAAFEHASLERGAQASRHAWGTVFERPLTTCPAEILAAVRGAGATVLAVSWEEGEYDARFALITAAAAARTRHVHMIGVGRRAFLASMMASTGTVFELMQALRASMRPMSRFAVRSLAGTHLEVEMSPHLRWFANGHLVRPGQFINVPFGALISSPASVSGTYVADASIGGGFGARVGLIEARPVRLSIEGGRVRRVECRDLAVKRYVEAFLGDGQGHDRIGLISIGANLGIRSPIGEIVHDENMPGLHIALGEPFPARTGATWTSHGQLAFASGGSDVDLDGEPLIRRGRYVRFV
ncbi:MAG: hypothetical protein IT372_24175 [Polyangiaceae bacterium]|nr:hypothetical protein [Polyangiaceae bacterium]